MLLAACATHWRRHLRVLVIAALDTGARQGELLKLRWSNIAFDEGVIKNVTSYKDMTVQRREVPLTGRLRAALLDLKQKRGAATFKRGRTSGNKPGEAFLPRVLIQLRRMVEIPRIESVTFVVRLCEA